MQAENFIGNLKKETLSKQTYIKKLNWILVPFRHLPLYILKMVRDIYTKSVGILHKEDLVGNIKKKIHPD
jgi:hypothetical protein